MGSQQFDFAVLGDGQPEGLLAAAALARKGYSVTVIPSSALGELPAEDVWPVTFPSQIGSKRTDELLFRAGFFQLDEAGLMSVPYSSQVVLPKHRLLFDGSTEQWITEVKREFPAYADSLVRVMNMVKRPEWIRKKKNYKSILAELISIQKKSKAVRQWLSTEVSNSLHPKEKRTPEIVAKAWLSHVMGHSSKVYCKSDDLKQPFHSFLLEHARKWGVEFWSKGFEYKRLQMGRFEFSPGAKAKYLVLNGIGGGREMARTYRRKTLEKMQYWLYVEDIHCPLDCIPEPLQTTCQIDLEPDSLSPLSIRSLYKSREVSANGVHLKLGTWLHFEKSSYWVSEITKSRELLKKVIPFMPPESFKTLPGLLELTELRGNCIRRGQYERLIPYRKPRGFMNRVFSEFVSKRVFSKKPYSVARKVFAVTPHYLPWRNRGASFQEALKLTDHFNKKRRKSAAV